MGLTLGHGDGNQGPGGTAQQASRGPAQPCSRSGADAEECRPQGSCPVWVPQSPQRNRLVHKAPAGQMREHSQEALKTPPRADASPGLTPPGGGGRTRARAWRGAHSAALDRGRGGDERQPHGPTTCSLHPPEERAVHPDSCVSKLQPSTHSGNRGWGL